MSIDKTTLNRIRIAIQHTLCSTIHDDVNYESMSKACVDLGIIEKVEDFDDETFTHSAILFEKIWEKVGDSHYKSPLELFEAWGKDEVAIYCLGDELEDFPESALAWELFFNTLYDNESTSNFLFVGKDFAKLYVDRIVAELNDMQREAFELMQEYSEQKERHDKAMFIGAKIFGRKDGKLHKTKKGRKFIKLYDPETGEYLGPLVKPMTHEEAHGKKEPVSDIKVNFNKEAWDKLKYEHDTDQPHFKLAKASLFNPDKGVLEVTIDKDSVEKIVDILGIKMSDEEILEKTNAARNSAEIFCRATEGSYKDFNNYAAEFGAFTPYESLKLPYIVDESIRYVNLLSELSELELNVPLLVYSVYNHRYKDMRYPYGASDIVFDILKVILELKKEGMLK